MSARRLPPLNGLRAFEAAARHLSFSRAADELCVTQGAVSRQVAKLESHLGAALFRREHRRIGLTPKGARFFAVVHDALDRIAEGGEIFSRGADDNRLKVKAPPTFAIRWFVPRLTRFHGLYPEIDVQITTSHQPVDFDREDVDVAVHWGTGDWEGLEADFLIAESLTPVCSPALLEERALRTPADLAGHVLLHSMNRTDDWRIWLKAAGESGIDTARALKFENSGLTYQAAIEGLGVVVAQLAFVADDLASGRLVAPFELSVPGERAYYLVYPPVHRERRKIALFRDWLLEGGPQREPRAAHAAAGSPPGA